MTTYIDRARDRVDREREAVGAKRAAYDRFRSRIESIPPRAAVSPRATTDGTGETLVSASSGESPVREAFTETVASALAAGGVSPPLRRAVLSESDWRRVELAAMERALDAEADSLARANETVEPIREWLLSVGETPLSACGFEALRAPRAPRGVPRGLRCARTRPAARSGTDHRLRWEGGDAPPRPPRVPL